MGIIELLEYFPELKEFPNGLQEMSCSFNNFVSLPQFPDEIKMLKSKLKLEQIGYLENMVAYL